MKVDLLKQKEKINEIVEIHLDAFEGFFLTFLGKGFLKNMYEFYLIDENSGIIVAEENGRILGFLAYSRDISSFYKKLLKEKFIKLGWYSFLAFLRKPKVIFRLIRSFKYSENSKRNEKYIELSSIGVISKEENKNIGTKLINKLKEIFEETDEEYIKLETDAQNNEKANCFYQKNGFRFEEKYITPEGREMNEYRFYLKNWEEK